MHKSELIVLCDVGIWLVALGCGRTQEEAFNIAYYDHISCILLLQILNVRWSLCVSILKIIVHAIGCHESIVRIILHICFISLVRTFMYFARCGSSSIFLYFEMLVVIIFHVFCCSIMFAMRWGLHVSILKIIVRALGCHESMEWIIFCIFLFVDAHLHLFRKVRQQLYIVIFWIAYCDYISCILLFNNACHEMGSACFNFENYCSCSQLPWEHSMNNLLYFLFGSLVLTFIYFARRGSSCIL